MKNKGLRFMLLFVVTIAWMVLMRQMTAPMDSRLILQFEFIGSAANAASFLSTLSGSRQLELLTRNLFLDLVFPLLYGATFYYASAWICSKLPKRHIFNVCSLMNNLTILAVISDLIENFSLLMLIYYPPTDLAAYVAYFFAGLKFLLLAIVFTHFIISGLIVILDSSRNSSQNSSQEI
jgi:hypothetical protein